MKPTPFDPVHDLAPIAFDESTLNAAFRLKEAGLIFRPHVGCFVWDREECIEVPSPFPNRVYFVLNIGRFETILGSRDAIAEQLIWIPTEHQTRILLEQRGHSSLSTNLVELYGELEALLQDANGRSPAVG